MLFKNKNLSPNFRLKRFLYRGGVNCKFLSNRFLNLRFLLVGFYCIQLTVLNSCVSYVSCYAENC